MTPSPGKPNPFQIVSNPKPIPSGAVLVKDPVCHMDVYPPNAAGSHEHNGVTSVSYTHLTLPTSDLV